MKNTFFLQNEVEGATVIQLTNLIERPEELLSLSYDQAVNMLGENPLVTYMVEAALTEGEVFALEYDGPKNRKKQNKKVKELVCDALDTLLEQEVNLFVEAMVTDGSTDRLKAAGFSAPCEKAIVGLYELAVELADPAKADARAQAGMDARRQAEENHFNQFQTKEENVQMTTINGLTIGAAATAKVGVGIVKGFEGTNNEIVVLEIAGSERKVFANTVIPGVHAVEVKPVDPNAAAQVAAWEAEARAIVDNVVVNMEMSEEEIFEAKENARLAQQEQWRKNRNKAATQAVNGGAASRILQMGAALLGTEAPAPQVTAAEAPAAGPQAPGRKNVLQRAMDNHNNKNNNGGNVQMTNNNNRGTQVDRPEVSVAGRPGASTRIDRGATSRPKAAAEAAVSTGRGGNAGATTRRPSPEAAGAPVTTGRGGSVRIGKSAVVAPKRKGLALKAEAPVANNYVAQPWYMNDRFENVMSGEAFEETRQNPALGITHALFWTPEAYNARFNREAQESELAVLQVFVGETTKDERNYVTGGISIEFRLRYSSNPDAKTPWYCNNITFIENKKGNGGRWHYTVGKRSDRYAVVVDQDYAVRMATEDDMKNHKDAVQYVGSNEWKNERIYGVDISEAFIAQVMRWAAYGWDCMNEEDAE